MFLANFGNLTLFMWEGYLFYDHAFQTVQTRAPLTSELASHPQTHQVPARDAVGHRHPEVVAPLLLPARLPGDQKCHHHHPGVRPRHVGSAALHGGAPREPGHDDPAVLPRLAGEGVVREDEARHHPAPVLREEDAGQEGTQAPQGMWS